MRRRELVAAVAAAAVCLPASALAQEVASVAASPVLTATGLALLGLAPFLLVVTTSFAKFAVVLSILRSALGTQNVPPNTVLAALALILSAYVMAPVFADMAAAAEPLATLSAADARDLLAWPARLADVLHPLTAFLQANAGDAELLLFADLRDVPLTDAGYPISVVVPAFALTELAEAFQIGFLLFLPFLVLDLLVGSVLLSLGMHMLSPTTVSLPFKLLLFVLVNGWIVLSESLVLGYTYPTP